MLVMLRWVVGFWAGTVQRLSMLSELTQSMYSHACPAEVVRTGRVGMRCEGISM